MSLVMNYVNPHGDRVQNLKYLFLYLTVRLRTLLGSGYFFEPWFRLCIWFYVHWRVKI